eukprot:5659642-Pyramimonas_sp.AAC.1
MNARVCTLWNLLQGIIDVDDKTSISRGKMTKHVAVVLICCTLGWDVPDGAATGQGEGGVGVYSNKG